MYKTPIIVFEGIEGSGKSLHINNVVKFLKKKRRKFIKIREPGGNQNSERIRKLILSNKSKFDKTTDLLLYSAARNENIINVINKNLRNRIPTIIRRFVNKFKRNQNVTSFQTLESTMTVHGALKLFSPLPSTSTRVLSFAHVL